MDKQQQFSDSYGDQKSFLPPPLATPRFPSNPVLTGFFAGSGAAGHAPLTTAAHETILVCRHLPALPGSRTVAEQVVS